MYKVRKPTHSLICANERKVGEAIEAKMSRILTNQEPITDGAPILFTERKDGVIPDYNVRSDRFEIAVDVMDKQARASLAKRAELLKPKEEAKKEPEKGAGDQQS